MPNGTQVACYYFPNYHVDPRNERDHGAGWTEWELVRRAEPRFAGHQQPRVPIWGYEDESDPAVMAKKIAAAANHGIDAFLFDWYYYDDGPFLERGLEQGFFGAPNRDRLKFALMWANHNWVDIHPAKRSTAFQHAHLLYPGAVTSATFDAIVELVIERYFKHPCYWLIDGCPYFSIYELHTLIEGLGGVAATRDALAHFRARVKAAGFPDLHLNDVAWDLPLLPGETAIADPQHILSELGFDSITSYVWIHHVPLSNFPETPYQQVMATAIQHWQTISAAFTLPYFPNVSMGWDSSPRTVQSDRFVDAGYPFMATLSGNTPAAFQQALAAVKQFLDARTGPRIFTINAWNEWTEGSYLEPDTVHGMGYLEAIRAVFGTADG
ncbi:MAG: glycoside hydrolase family 99-like domain-containing protein [Caldilineaceae bacterium]